MHEMCPLGIFARQGNNVVLYARTQRTSTECKAVVWVVHCREEPFYVLVAVHYAWQAKHRDWRVVGMHTHVYSRFLAHRHYRLKEILHVLTQLILVNALVEVEELSEQLYRVLIVLMEVAAHETLGLYHYVLHQSVVLLRCHCLCQLVSLSQYVAVAKLVESCPFLSRSLTLQDVYVEISELGIREKEVRRPIGVVVQQVSACPVEHRHEVVAYCLHSLCGKIAHRLFVDFDLLVAVRSCIFYSLHHGQTLHHAPSHTERFNILAQVAYRLACPYFAQRHIVQGSHNALHTDLF